MSVREEDKKKGSSSNTGLKIAAAVGTAAAAVAMYYLFSRPERDEGETSHAQQHSLARAETESEHLSNLRQQQFRQRSWSLEECSICCEVMLNNQEITALPCSHNFHTKCLMPWIEQKETCPNCRKNI